MGGGGHGPHVQHAWSPSGGWFFIPKNWKSNTIVISAGLILSSAVIYAVGKKITYRSDLAYDDETIARWNNAAKKARETSAVAEVAGK